MTLLGSFGAISLKLASRSIHSIREIVHCKWLPLGIFLYLASSVINIILLRQLDYTKVLPITALTYIWTLPLSRLIFGEQFDVWKIGAMVLILAGVFMIAFF